MNEYEDQRNNPDSYCYKCKNYHWGCPAVEWNDYGEPIRNDGKYARFCHSRFDGEE